LREKCGQEAEAVAKFLMNLDLKMRRTQLMIKEHGGKHRYMNAEYVLGKDLHFQILSNSAKIIKLCPNIDSRMSLNKLSNI